MGTYCSYDGKPRSGMRPGKRLTFWQHIDLLATHRLPGKRSRSPHQTFSLRYMPGLDSGPLEVSRTCFCRGSSSTRSVMRAIASVIFLTSKMCCAILTLTSITCGDGNLTEHLSMLGNTLRRSWRTRLEQRMKWWEAWREVAGLVCGSDMLVRCS